MDWMTTVRDFWLNRLALLAGLAVVFAVLSRLTPCNRGMSWWTDRRAARADLLYWLVVPLLLHFCRAFLLGLGVLLLYAGKDLDALPARSLPAWLQLALILLLQDVFLYWAHRAFHGRLGWRFHAVHHSPKILDWLSTHRFHPVNDLLAFVVADVVVLLLGFSPAVVAVLAPFNIVYSAMVHANLNWTFGPLRHVFASPVFHRWHHTTEHEGLNKNFAPTFPFLDCLFGTYYMPPGKLPENFGNGEDDFPEGFWGQLIHPVVAGVSPGSPGAIRRRLAWTAAGMLGIAALVVAVVYAADARLHQPHQGEEESEIAVAPPAPVTPLRTMPVLSVALSGDGRRAASGGEDGLVTLWDVAARKATHSLTGHARAVCAVALSGDGRRAVSGGQDGAVRVWDADTGAEQLTLIASHRYVRAVSISGDGRSVAAASVDGKVTVWDARSGEVKLALTADPGTVLGVSLSGDGDYVALATGRAAKVWRVPSARQTVTLKGHTDLVYSIALSADGRRVVTGSFDLTAKLWDAESGAATQTLVGHSGPVYAVAISGDGGRIVTGGKDGAVMVWDAATGRVVATPAGHGDSVTAVAISKDGHTVASAGRDGVVKFEAVKRNHEIVRRAE